MTTLREQYELQAVEPYVPSLDWKMTPFPVDSEELIGIEVEIENVRRIGDGLAACWQITEDGSLRNQGREFITYPMPAKYAPVALENLAERLKEAAFTPRTSVHVHLNVQDLTLDQIGDIVLLYTLFEKLFFRYVGRNRIRSPYCVPITATALLGNFAKNVMKARWEKYAGFNLCPIQNKGTLEFRHMNGTFNIQKLSGWINLITSLKDYVKATPTKTIRATLAGLQHYDVPALMVAVFPKVYQLLKWENAEEFKLPILYVKYAMTNRSGWSSVANTVDTQKGAFFKVKD